MKRPDELMVRYCDAADRFDLDALVGMHDLPMLVISKNGTKIYGDAQSVRGIYERLLERFSMVDGARMVSSHRLNHSGPAMCFSETVSTVYDKSGDAITTFNLTYALRKSEEGYVISLVAMDDLETMRSPLLDCSLNPTDPTPLAA